MADDQTDAVIDTGKGANSTVYTASALSIWYDFYVLGFNMRLVWGCPTKSVLLPFFAEHMSNNHLDIGVATGYLPGTVLASIWRRDSRHRLTLMDINPNPLQAARARILAVTTQTEVECIEADATQPAAAAALAGRRLDSISMCNLFHCMPGGADKFAAVAHVSQLLADDGVLFGCTVLGISATARHQYLRRFYLHWYNHWWGVFANWDDKREDLDAHLRRHFDTVETWLVGIVLLFRATKPRRGPAESALVGLP